MRKIISVGVVCAMFAMVFATGMTTAIEYDGYREHLYARWGTPTIDGNFTTVEEYGPNEYYNSARCEYYLDNVTLKDNYPANEFSIYVMNDNTTMYFMVDFTYINVTETGVGLMMYLDLNFTYDVEFETDGIIEIFYSPLDESAGYGAYGIEYKMPLNASGFWSSPNAYYNHSIIEFGMSLANLRLEPGDTFPIIAFFGDDSDAYNSFPRGLDLMGDMFWGNVTLAEEPEIVEPESWLIFETPNYCFGSDAYINISININVTIDIQKFVVCEMETHWLGAPTYRVNIDLDEKNISDCEIYVIMNYKDVAKSIKGYFPKASIRMWLDDVKYQCVEASSIIEFNEDLGTDGGYIITIDEDTTVQMIEVIVNCDIGDYWDNLRTRNL